MKNLKIILIGLAVLTITGLSVAVGYQHKNIKNLNKTVDFQRETIDSLLALPPAESITLEVELHVTDKSKLTVNGKGNSGQIYVPQERHYVVEIDSTSLGLIRKDDVK